jgi:hypothetical protein
VVLRSRQAAIAIRCEWHYAVGTGFVTEGDAADEWQERRGRYEGGSVKRCVISLLLLSNRSDNNTGGARWQSEPVSNTQKA